MATIVTRSGKGSPLTNAEVDGNFTNLNTELGTKANTSSLATVATTGAYSDLTGKPTNVSSLTNDSAYVTSAALSAYQPLDGDLTAIAALAGTTGFVTKTAANTYTLDTSSYITGITSGNVTTALGYTPYNATNPSGYITSAGSISGNAATATNISNTGTVTLASATESNSIYATAPSYTADQPTKLLNFDWYSNVFSIGNIRSGSTGSNGFGVYYTASGGSRAEIARFTPSGNFGIGTSSVAGRLHSVSTSGFTAPTLLCGDGVGTFRVVFQSGSYAGVPANKPWLHSYDDIYIGSDANVSTRFMSGGVTNLTVASSGIVTASTAFNAPIFTDSANSGYYVDPAGTSNINLLTASNRSMVGYAQISMSGLDAATYYPVTIPIPIGRQTTLRIENALNSNAPSWSTHGSGFSCYFEWTVNGNGWGTIGVSRRITDWREAFTSVQIVGGIDQMNLSSQEVIWLRGGANYFFSADCDVTPTIRTTSYSLNGQTVAPRSTVFNDPWAQAFGKMAYGTFQANERVTAGTDMRAPIFYDSGNTAYYLDPTGSTSLNAAGNLLASGNLVLNNGANRYVRIGSATNYSYDLQTTGDDFQIIEAGVTPRLTIKYPTGFVGLNTASPSANLEAFGVDASIITHHSGQSRGGIAALSGGRIALTTTTSNDDLVFGYAASPITSASFVPRMTIDNGSGIVTAATAFNAPVFNDSVNSAFYIDPKDGSNLGGTVQINGGPVYRSDWTTRFQSGSDFVDGTLVTTDIPATASEGESFVIEITGKTYDQNNPPVKVVAQGYLYNNQIINYSGISYAGNFATYIKVFQDGGVLKFWWPRISYWNSFNVNVMAMDGPTNNTISRNRVTAIGNAAEPTGTKKVQITLTKTLKTGDAAGSISGFNNPVTAPTANTIVYRDSAGDISAREIVLSSGLSAQTPTVLVSMYPATNQMVRTTPAAVSAAIQGAASGSWGISVTGSAATASKATNLNQARYSNTDFNTLGSTGQFFRAYTNYIPSGGSYNQPPNGSGDYKVIQWGDVEGGDGATAGNWGGQIVQNFYTDQMWFRRSYGTTWQAWREFIHDGNYTSFAMPIGSSATNSVDVRAPIFYDSNDTSYYVNPNEISRTHRMGANYFETNNDVSVDTPFGLYFNGGLSQSYGIFRESGAWSHPYPDLRIAFHTGIKMGALAGYGGMRFYTNSDMATQVMSINNSADGLGGGHVFVNDVLQAGGSLRAPIFYKSDDTISRWDGNALVLRGASPTLYLRDTDHNSAMIHCNSNLLYVLRGGNDTETWATVGSGSWPLVINLTNNDITGGGTINAVTDMRAPIFYDSANTAYFVNPNGTSYVSGEFQIVGSGYNSLRITSSSTTQSLWVRAGYNSDGSATPAVSATNVMFQSSGSSAGTFSFVSGNTLAVSIGGDTATVANYLTGTNSLRAPVFYDSNNTAYYLNPNDTQSLRTVGDWRSDSSAWTGEFSGKIQYHANHWYFQSAGQWIFRKSDGQTAFEAYQNGTAIAYGDMRSPLFYDNNNTGYYADPNGTSRMGTINSDLLRSYTNVFTDQNHGYGLVGVYSSYRYQGVFAMGDSYKLPADGTTTGSLYGICWSHPNAGGVAGNLNSHGALFLENGSFLAAVSGSIRCRDDMRAPIYYDSNDTAGYINPAGASWIKGGFQMNVASASNDCFGGLEMREAGLVANTQTAATYAPGINFHWGSVGAARIYMSSSGAFVLGGQSDITNNRRTLFCADLNATGNVTAYYSDERLKTRIGNIDNALDIISKLSGFRYVNNDLAKSFGYESDEVQLGVSAQEVEAVLPEVVRQAAFDIDLDDPNGGSKTGENYKTVQYDRLIPLLIEAIKELRHEVEMLKK